jgi:tetratricopeptide (TPR) repeat protein
MSGRALILAIVAALLAVIPYLPRLHYPFVYDDHGVLLENPFLDEPENLVRVISLRTFFDRTVIDGQRPVVLATYFFDRFAWGQWPPGYRITNLLLHALNAGLAFWLVGALFASDAPDHRLTRYAPALLAALWFGWHPLAIEAVQSPAFREDLLYVFGGMAYLFLALRPSGSWHHALGGTMALAFSLLTKESAVIFPALLAVLWWLFPSFRPARSMVCAWLVLSAALVAAFGAALWWGGSLQSVGGDWNGYALRGAERIWTPPWLYALTVAKMIVPWPLSIDYRIDPLTGPLNIFFFMGAGAVLASIVLVLVLRRRSPGIALGAAWALIAFIPVSNVIPLFNPVADRYAYGLLPGLALIGAWIIFRGRTAGRILGVTMLAAALLITAARLGDWRSDRALWTAAIRVEPESARAHTWLGLEEKYDGRLEEAWRLFTEAERLNPQDVTPVINRAVMLGQQGDLPGAEKLLREVLVKRPGHKAAQQNLDYCLMLLQQETR